MKYKLSKNDWLAIGKKMSWIKTAQDGISENQPSSIQEKEDNEKRACERLMSKIIEIVEMAQRMREDKTAQETVANWVRNMYKVWPSLRTHVPVFTPYETRGISSDPRNLSRLVTEMEYLMMLMGRTTECPYAKESARITRDYVEYLQRAKDKLRRMVDAGEYY